MNLCEIQFYIVLSVILLKLFLKYLIANRRGPNLVIKHKMLKVQNKIKHLAAYFLRAYLELFPAYYGRLHPSYGSST